MFRADQRNIPFFLSNDQILNFWTTIVIQVSYIVIKKARNKCTLFNNFDNHFCIHCVYVVKNIKEFVIFEFSNAARISMQMIGASFCLFITFVVCRWTKWTSLYITINKKSQFFFYVFPGNFYIKYKQRHAVSDVGWIENGR